MSQKSLQINISSVDDAKSVIANLGSIKAAWQANGCDSVEFVIMEELVTPVMRILVGAIPWCVHYRKIVRPFEGNVFFPLPHYQAPVRQVALPEPREGRRSPGRKVTRNGRPSQEALGKTAPLVPAQPAGAS